MSSKDACAYDTSNWLRSYIWDRFTKKGGPDFQHDAVGSQHGWGASNAFAVPWRNTYVFIQMNYYPEYEVHLGHSGGTNNVAWTSALPFLRKQLENTKSKGQRAILNWHAAMEPSADLKKILEEYKDNIAAIFTGHTHVQASESKFYGINIPHYTSGALFKSESYRVRVYLKDFWGDKMTVDSRADITALGQGKIQYISSVVYKDGKRLLCFNGALDQMPIEKINNTDGCQ